MRQILKDTYMLTGIAAGACLMVGGWNVLAAAGFAILAIIGLMEHGG